MAIYDPATYDIRTAVGPLLGRARSVFLTALEERLAGLGLNAADYLVLVIVARDESPTASAVCSTLLHDPGAMTRKIDALEKRGLLRRARSSEDRRAIHLELTAEGKKLYPKAITEAVTVANEMLEGFTKTEVRTLESMLARILENAEARETVKG